MESNAFLRPVRVAFHNALFLERRPDGVRVAGVAGDGVHIWGALRSATETLTDKKTPNAVLMQQHSNPQPPPDQPANKETTNKNASKRTFARHRRSFTLAADVGGPPASSTTQRHSQRPNYYGWHASLTGGTFKARSQSARSCCARCCVFVVGGCVGSTVHHIVVVVVR